MELTPTQAEIRFEEGRSFALRSYLMGKSPIPTGDFYDGWKSVRPVEHERVEIQLVQRNIACAVSVIRKHNLYPNGLILVRVFAGTAATHLDLIDEQIVIQRAMLSTYGSLLHSVETPIVIQWKVD